MYSNMIVSLLWMCVDMIMLYYFYCISGKASTKTVKHLKKIPEGSRQHDMMKVRDLDCEQYRPVLLILIKIVAMLV